jgi:flagellin
MSTRINTNTTAFDASVNLSKNTAAESQDIERLSSGLRINSAADDPSGYVLSQSLQAQSGSITQATNNTNDAINVVKTAEGALTQVQSLLVNIRQTIVQAANVGTNNSTALTADAQAVSDSVASIDRIASTTQFNGKNLLDGSADSAGASFTAGTGAVAPAVGKNLAVTGQAAAYGAAGVASGNVVLVSGAVDVEKAAFTGGTAADTFGGSFTIEGKNVSLSGNANTITDIQTAIAQQTGLSYTVTGTAAAGTGLSFTKGTSGAVATAASFTGLNSFTAGVAASTATASSVTTAGTNTHLTVDGFSSNPVSADGTTYSFTSGQLKGLSLDTSTPAGAAGTSTTLGTFAATDDTAVAGTNLQFQIGSNQNQTVSLAIGSTKSNNIGSYTDATSGTSYKLQDLLSGGALDLTDVTGKSQQTALGVIDQAISDISAASEKLGSVQTNVLQSNINSLAVSQSNNDSSLSTVRDTDLAATVVDYTKNQILVQAGTSALSYANQAPQAILKLLQ